MIRRLLGPAAALLLALTGPSAAAATDPALTRSSAAATTEVDLALIRSSAAATTEVDLALIRSSAAAITEVDLALILAVDISNSMDPEEQELQRRGFVEAFRSPLVHDAIRGGTLGRIAVTYVEWAGESRQSVVASWTVIEGAEDASAFADQLSSAPIQRGPRTSISAAIDFSVRHFERSGVEPLRRVIDISGDGANNQGRLVTLARDAALAQGITINGLPIMLNRSVSYWDVGNLDLYYRDCVIGGAGAFMVPVRQRHQFADAIKQKIIREIAGLEPELRPIPAQAETPVSCLAGEARDWDMRRN